MRTGRVLVHKGRGLHLVLHTSVDEPHKHHCTSNRPGKKTPPVRGNPQVDLAKDNYSKFKLTSAYSVVRQLSSVLSSIK